MDIKALGLTLGIHACLLFPLVSCSVPIEQQEKQGGEEFKQEEIVFITATPEGDKPCESSYLGIGILSNLNGEVLSVSEGGPAWKAGIREGDVVENTNELWPDAFPEGTQITLNCKRGETSFTRVVKIERVCYA